jgi:hypothetical protein
MWLSHARAQCECFESGEERDVFEGVHDGYLRLSDPVRHRRGIEFDKRSMRIEVMDTLECSEEHSVEVHWHLAEGCVARVSGHAVEVSCANVRMRVECPRELGTPEVVVGRDDPPLGWISRRLGEKKPSPSIVCTGRIAGGTSLVTVVTVAIVALSG